MFPNYGIAWTIEIGKRSFMLEVANDKANILKTQNKVAEIWHMAIQNRQALDWQIMKLKIGHVTDLISWIVEWIISILIYGIHLFNQPIYTTAHFAKKWVCIAYKQNNN